jgi:hypothetical protein
VNPFFRSLRLLALGTWIGALVYFVAVVTRGAFAVLSRDQAGLLVGFTLSRLHIMGLIAAAIFVFASLVLHKSARAFLGPAVLGVILMATLTAVSEYQVIPRMDALRRQMDSVEATPSTDPRRAEFDRLHSLSVDLEGAVVLMGIVAFFFAARGKES